ncbi:MAG: response regulator transcription factor [Deltaproteobacteria bacterium]|nr:response regulator transcription factor [Deltaproteobacteria bacterium]
MNFRLKGFKVLTASNGDEAMRKAFDDRPDLIILDIMLPGYSGLDVLDELRNRGEDVPVLILSARGKVEHKVEGFSLGADDYMAKPFDLEELFARVDALLRRGMKENETQPLLRYGNVVIDQAGRQVKKEGNEVALSAKEFDLLCLLAKSPGQTFTRDTILDRIWGWGFEGTPRTVDNFIMSLRRKLEDDPTHPRHLRTVRQIGYRLDP